MNKLLFVNIGGVVFQIDESAYKKLENYLNSIRRKYANAAEGEEIIKDIENRIAELFTEKVGERGAIIEAYVDEVISVMGTPEDFEDGPFTTGQSGQTHRTEYQHTGPTKFYRDKENNILGGVCAGLAAKFGIDALWIRLLFLVAFFVGGTGFLLYIILWIIIPEAKTTAEKLEMRGERVDISNIERTVRDGAKQFGTKMNEFGEEVRTTFSKENMDKTKRNTGDFIESAVETLKPGIKWIAKVFSLFVLILSLVIVIALTVEIASNWGSNFTDIEFFGNHITEGSNQAWILVSCALALVIIPLVGIMISAVKFLLGIRQKTRFISTSLGILWTAAFIAVIYIGITIGRNFQYEANVSNKYPVEQPANDVMYLKLEKTDFNWPFNDSRNDHKAFKKGSDAGVIKIDDEDSIIFRQITVNFERSADSNYVVLINKLARGYDRTNAKSNAQRFEYDLKQMGDSTLYIPSLIRLNEKEPWREQEVEITIRVPVDKYIMIDQELDFYIDDNEYTADLKDIELYNNKLKMTPGGLKPTW